MIQSVIVIANIGTNSQYRNQKLDGQSKTACSALGFICDLDLSLWVKVTVMNIFEYAHKFHDSRPSRCRDMAV